MLVFLISAALSSAAFFLIGLQLPKAGIDGGVGLRMRDAVLAAADDLRASRTPVKIIVATGARPVQNPHQDEGSDNDDDVAAAPAEVAALRKSGIRVIVGPLRSNVALFEEPALAQHGSVAISATARAPYANGSRVFKLTPSDRQLAAAAYTWMRIRYGPRVCVLDDGTSKARREADAFMLADPRATRATLAELPAMQRCVRSADGVYTAALAADPVICSGATARRAGVERLVRALALRGFDAAEFARDGGLWRADPTPIRRTAAIQAFSEHYHARAFVAADDAAIRYYAALQVAAEAARFRNPSARLRSAAFPTILGTLGFNARGELRTPSIVVHRLD